MFAKHIRSVSIKTFEYLTIRRGIVQNASVAANEQFTPIEIDVPWGKISGKLWGKSDKQPLLTLHGWMDNAGSFDILAPLLTKNSSVLAIDLPGHGLSSWHPHGIPYNEDSVAIAMRAIVKYFNWDKVKLLGHSMGGILCFNYARLFPKQTQFVVSIDSLSFIPRSFKNHNERRAVAIDKLLDFEKKDKINPPSYPEDVAIKKWIEATIFSSLDVPATKTLMIRGAKRKEDGTYYYTRDYRLSFEGFNCYYSAEAVKEMSQAITCPYLVLKASESPFHKAQQYWETVGEVLQKTSQDFQSVSLEGTHHMHMMKAEMVADVINPFLEKYDT